MYGKMITSAGYRELLKKVNIYEITLYLKSSSAYSGVLADVDASLIHRGQLEDILRKEFFEQQIRICKFSAGTDKTILNSVIFRYEIEQILSFIRFLKGGRGERYIYSVPEYIINYSSLNFTGFSGAKTYSEFLSLIINTEFYKIMKDYNPDEDSDLSRLENLLFTYFYTRQLKAINKYSKNIKDTLDNAFGSEIEILNLSHILRLKKHYNSSNEEIFNHIIPFYQNISKQKFMSIISAENEQAVLDIISSTKYRSLFGDKNYKYPEKYLFKFTYDFYKKIMLTSFSSIMIPVAYFNLKDIEIKNLITIIESKRYGLTEEETIENLILIS